MALVGFLEIFEDEKQELLQSEADFREFRLAQFQEENTRKQNQFLLGGGLFLAIALGLSLIFFQRTRNRYLQQQLRANLEVENLKTKIYPYFIATWLQSLKSIIKDDKRLEAINYLSEISGVFKGIISCNAQENITLARELEYLKSYLALEHLRLEGGLHYDFKVSSDIHPQKINIPTLLIHPFLEDALNNDVSKISILLSRAAEANSIVKCKIEDDGAGRV